MPSQTPSEQVEANILKNTRRIYNNILFLLKNGLFIGESAKGVSEAQNFVNGMLDATEENLKKYEKETDPGPAAE